MTLNRDVKLTTDSGRLILRPYVLDDASAIFEAVDCSRAELEPWMDWCTPEYSIEDALAWLRHLPAAWRAEEIFGFGVFGGERGQFLGGCGLSNILWPYRLANLGYWIRSDRTGEGIATEAARRVARFGVEVLGLRRIEIVAAEHNHASRRVAVKTGATFEGILRNRIKVGDRSLDAAMYSLIPEDFPPH